MNIINTMHVGNASELLENRFFATYSGMQMINK